MIPIDLNECLKKILCLKFNEEPPYDYILYCLNLCFEKVVNARIPIGPPSNDLAPQYVFEWNRTLANRVRNTLIAQN